MATAPQTPVIVPPATSAPAASEHTTPAEPQSSIKEFKLAQSSFSHFATDILQTGSLSAVRQARLLANGKAEITMDDGADQVLSIAAIGIDEHSRSDSWIQIVAKTSEQVTLNTVDHF